MQPSVFIVEDNAAVRQALLALLTDYRVTALASLPELFVALKRETPSLVLLDMNFTRDTTSGKEGLDALAAMRPLPPVIMLTAWGTVEAAVAAMKLGAKDYLTKPWDNERLLTAVRTQVRLGSHDTADANDNAWSALQGGSDAFARVLKDARRVAATDATVLLTGESGTGKSMLARAIHAASARRTQPFVEVHVGALPESLFERELFGHVRGAFTDAREGAPGRVAAAKGGTLFLDELATLGPLQQVKLLRLVQDGVFEPVGSNKTQRADVRIIAATNLDLRAAVASGAFRQDLFFRLSVFPIRMPSLKDRIADVTSLAEHFLRQACAEHALSVTGFTPSATQALLAHDWPGNIRELQHLVTRSAIRQGDGLVASVELDEAEAPTALAQLERDAVERVMAAHANNITKAAAALGITRQALYRRLEKLAR